jgi:Peptidase family M23
MSWEDIMRRVLPPIGGVSPHITGPAGTYGAGLKEGRVPPSTIPHGGVDFNYFGGRTARLNLSHPALRSPVDGIVVNAGQGTMGRIAIRDKDGFVHEILHSDKRHVAIGDPVVAGQLIGTMGNTGTHDQHVHYQLKDPSGKDISPSAFWDRQGPVDPNPTPPAYLQEYQQYLQDTGGNKFGGAPTPPNNGPSPSRTAFFSDRFGNWGSTSASIAPSAAPDRPESFDNRFGNWGTTPAGRFGNTRSPVLRALEKYSGSAVPDGSASAPAQGASWGRPSSPPNSIGTGGVLGNYIDPSLIDAAQGALPTRPLSSGPIAPDLPTDETASSKSVRILSRRIAGQPQASVFDTDAPAVPPSPQLSEPLVGIFSGQPMLPFPLPPSFWSRRDDTRVRDDDEERSLRWLRLLSPE